MYNVGEKIVYPMHGAGIIESIEERVVLGEKRLYYVLNMPVGDMRVMIPTCGAADIGVRPVVEFLEAEKVICFFRQCTAEYNASWNKRYRENMIRIKSGNIYEVAEVVKALMCRDRERGLSSGERKMLCSARQILISELSLAIESTQQDIESLLEEIIDKTVEALNGLTT